MCLASQFADSFGNTCSRYSDSLLLVWLASCVAIMPQHICKNEKKKPLLGTAHPSWPLSCYVHSHNLTVHKINIYLTAAQAIQLGPPWLKASVTFLK